MNTLKKVTLLMLALSCTEKNKTKNHLSLEIANKLDIIDMRYMMSEDSLYKEYILKTKWCVERISKSSDTSNVILAAIRPPRTGRYEKIEKRFPSLYENYINLTFIKDSFITTESGIPNFSDVDFAKVVWNNMDIVSKQKIKIFINEEQLECDCSSVSQRSQ